MKPFGHSVCHPLDELRFVLRGKMHEVRLVGIYGIGHTPGVRQMRLSLKPFQLVPCLLLILIACIEPDGKGMIAHFLLFSFAQSSP